MNETSLKDNNIKEANNCLSGLACKYCAVKQQKECLKTYHKKEAFKMKEITKKELKALILQKKYQDEQTVDIGDVTELLHDYLVGDAETIDDDLLLYKIEARDTYDLLTLQYTYLHPTNFMCNERVTKKFRLYHYKN